MRAPRGTNLVPAEGLATDASVTELRPVLNPQPGFCCVAFVPAERTRSLS